MSQAKPIAAFAARTRIPAISGGAEFAAAGNLMTSGPNLHETWRSLATYADGVRKGARPRRPSRRAGLEVRAGQVLHVEPAHPAPHPRARHEEAREKMKSTDDLKRAAPDAVGKTWA